MNKLKLLYFSVLLFILETISKLMDNPLFPSVSKIGNHIIRTIDLNWCQQFLFPSLLTLSMGFVFGTLFAIIFSMIISEIEIFEVAFLPIINFLRNIPSVAKIPIIISIFGIEKTSRIASISLAVFLTMFVSTFFEFKQTYIRYFEFSKIYQLSRIRSLFAIKLPLAAAGVITGLRASLQISLIIMVISEMLGSPIGLGAFLVHAQNLFDVYNLWMAIIILGTIGLLLNLVFDASVKRYFPWYQRLDKSLNDF